ncbi:hypothetical protein TI04_07480 [Achromatium sp. WMS2]|nr:hypothetical protein TI04_07480 [Achromatium sp. WMS2]
MISIVTITGIAGSSSLETELHRIQQLQHQIATETARQTQMAALGNTLAQLQSDITQQKELNQQPTMEQQIATVKDNIRRLTQEQSELERSITQIRSQINQQLQPNLIDKPNMVRILPFGKKTDQIPWFAVCESSESILLYKDATTKIRLDPLKLSYSTEYANFLNTIANTPQGILIFLIRDKGVETFDLAVTIAMNRNIKVGKLPLPWDVPLDMHNFYPQ